MNDALYRAGMKRERAGIASRREYWLGTRYETEAELAERWREHVAAVFEPERREKQEAERLEIEAKTPQAMAIVMAIEALIRGCSRSEMRAIERGLRLRNEMMRDATRCER